MDDYCGEFNRLVNELWQIFSITSDVQQMQNQWNQLMVLTLGILDHIYSSVRPQIMRNPIVSSLPETLLSEDCRSCGVIWHYYNNLRLICTRSSGEATAEEAVLKWKDEGSTLVDVLMAAVLLGADEEVLEEDEVALSSIITTTKTQTIQSISASFWRESQRECTFSVTLPNDKQLWCQFEQFQMFQQQQNTHTQSSSFSSTLAWTCTLYLVLHHLCLIFGL